MSARLVTDNVAEMITVNREQNAEYAGRNRRLSEGGLYGAIALGSLAFPALLVISKIIGGEEVVVNAFYLAVALASLSALGLMFWLIWRRAWTR